MRILHLDSDDIENPLGGGQPVRTFEVNRRLAERHRITVATATYAGAKRDLVREGVRYRRYGLNIPGLGLSPHLTFLASLPFVVPRLPHDLLVEEFAPPVGFALTPRWTRAPVVSVVQWFSFAAWEARYHLPFTRWMRALARKGLYRRFIVQTHAMRRVFEEMVPGCIVRRIPCGVSESAFLPVTGNAGDFGLYLGRVEAQEKGLARLLRIWRQAAPDIPLVIAGDGPDRESLQAFCDQNGLSGVVRLVGMVHGEAKNALLRDCRFLVIPSRAETFGIVALEAMAAAKPVIAFDIAHLNEVVRPQWGILAPESDEPAFGRAVRALWDSPEAAVALGRAGLDAARGHTWDRVAREQEAFYCEALHEAEA
ncbi:hypothetical protein JCM15519_20540 [Fundidesulfovibrio butyratiphilus]